MRREEGRRGLAGTVVGVLSVGVYLRDDRRTGSEAEAAHVLGRVVRWRWGVVLAEGEDVAAEQADSYDLALWQVAVGLAVLARWLPSRPHDTP